MHKIIVEEKSGDLMLEVLDHQNKVILNREVDGSMWEAEAMARNLAGALTRAGFKCSSKWN